MSVFTQQMLFEKQRTFKENFFLYSNKYSSMLKFLISYKGMIFIWVKEKSCILIKHFKIYLDFKKNLI